MNTQSPGIQPISIRFEGILLSDSSGKHPSVDFDLFIYELSKQSKTFKFVDFGFSAEGAAVNDGYCFTCIGDSFKYFKIPEKTKSSQVVGFSKDSGKIIIIFDIRQENIKELYNAMLVRAKLESIYIYGINTTPGTFLNKEKKFSKFINKNEISVSFNPYPDGLGIQSHLTCKALSKDDFGALIDDVRGGFLDNTFSEMLAL